MIRLIHRKRIGFALCAFLAFWQTAMAEEFVPAKANGVAGEYVVVLADMEVAGKGDAALKKSQIRDQSALLTARYGGSVSRVWVHAIPGFLVHTTEEKARQLARDPSVALVEQNRT